MITAPKDIFGVEFFRIMLHELTMKRVTEMLDVHERTIYQWLSQERVPRSASRALFWETRWGRSVIDCDHYTEIDLLRQRIHILERQVVKAKDIITGLRGMQYGTANEPLFDDLRDFDVVTPDTQQRAQIG